MLNQRYDIVEFEEKLKELRVSLDVDVKKQRVEEIDRLLSEPGAWDDVEKSQKLTILSKRLKDTIAKFESIENQIEEIKVMHELLALEEDEAMVEEAVESFARAEKELEKFSLQMLLSGQYDLNNAILSIHSGTGGLDAQDWSEMLFRMYSRWADSKGYNVRILDILRDTEAGIKSVTMLVEGSYAYGYLKSEKGVHRLVRISPFDSSGKRHTSFASVDIMPEIEGDVEVDINPVDLKIDTYRASGAGGQHVNKTDSAVRITHIPTGVVVQCQNERSQHFNKVIAMKMLMGRLIELKELEQKETIDDLAGDYSQIAWGSQIRSYVFHPYSMVKDHRTNAEVGNVNSVMDGNLDPFIDAYLKQQLK
ncbi:MAG: peptide chain release factor 2 [Bacillota bacterium]|nr:peptide chain release factor 2 [Bacillota bacterium]